MQLPALAVNTNGNLGQTLTTVMALKSAGLQNRLLERQIDKETALTDLRGQMFGVTGASAGSATASGGASPGTPALATKSDLMRRYMAIDLMGGSQIIDAVSKMNAEQRAQMKQQNEATAKLLLSVESVPPEQRPMAYQDALVQARQMGIPVDNAPRQYDPAWMQRNIMLGMGVDDILSERERGRTKSGDLVTVMTPQGPQFVKAEDAVGQSPYDATLQEVYDPNSPTGTRLVSRGEAAGQPGKPPSSAIEITGYDDSGRPLISVGGRGSTGKPTTKTRNDLQETLVNTQNALARLRSVGDTFDPSFLEIGTKWDTFKTRWREKAGLPVDEQDQAQLAEFADFRRTSVDNLNRYIKEITGAQVSNAEADRILGGLPNAGTGIFDGDSPTEFVSKWKSIVRDLSYAQARAAYALQNGIPWQDVPLSDMKGIMDERLEARKQEIREQNPDMEDTEILKVAVPMIAKEFGIQMGGR